ncbi:hypothetical protein ACLOJK_023552, partial [Asimina triloba]
MSWVFKGGILEKKKETVKPLILKAQWWNSWVFKGGILEKKKEIVKPLILKAHWWN